MKRIRDILFTVVLSLVLFFLSYNAVNDFYDEKERKTIEDSKPTTQEIAEFKTLLDENTYYYYNQLDDVDKEVYVTLYSALMSFDDSVILPTDEQTLNKLYTAVLYDNPHIFWVEHDYSYVINEFSIKFTPSYRYEEVEVQTISNQIEDKINEITDVADDYSSDYEKELYIHDYVCNNTVYDENVDGDSVYDVLINGKAVCEGYSKAVQILLDALDIDNYLVVGESVFEGELGPHMWNVVTIDGLNYHLDSTWNDSDEDNGIHYFYFNVTDEVISEDHFSLSPADNNCISEIANYHTYNNLVFDSFNGFDEHINRSADTLKNGENEVVFVFRNTDDYKKALSYIEKDNGFFRYVTESVRRSGRRIDTSEISYITIDEHNYLCVIFKEG